MGAKNLAPPIEADGGESPIGSMGDDPGFPEAVAVSSPEVELEVLGSQADVDRSWGFFHCGGDPSFGVHMGHSLGIEFGGNQIAHAHEFSGFDIDGAIEDFSWRAHLG